jgi:hypothetical protein
MIALYEKNKKRIEEQRLKDQMLAEFQDELLQLDVPEDVTIIPGMNYNLRIYHGNGYVMDISSCSVSYVTNREELQKLIDQSIKTLKNEVIKFEKE